MDTTLIISKILTVLLQFKLSAMRDYSLTYESLLCSSGMNTFRTGSHLSMDM